MNEDIEIPIEKMNSPYFIKIEGQPTASMRKRIRDYGGWIVNGFAAFDEPADGGNPQHKRLRAVVYGRTVEASEEGEEDIAE